MMKNLSLWQKAGLISTIVGGLIIGGIAPNYNSEASTKDIVRDNIQNSLNINVKQNHKTENNIAVLLIDMHNHFLKGIDIDEKEREIPYQIEVLNYCKNNEIPVFVLEYEGYGSTIDILKKKLDELNNKTYIVKPHEDGFIDTDLAEQLNHKGIKNILLMGVNASACVLRTAEGALKNGYNIMTSKELIADRILPYWVYWDFNESIDWYKQNGIYYDSYQDLIDFITKTGTGGS